MDSGKFFRNLCNKEHILIPNLKIPFFIISVRINFNLLNFIILELILIFKVFLKININYYLINKL